MIFTLQSLTAFDEETLEAKKIEFLPLEKPAKAITAWALDGVHAQKGYQGLNEFVLDSAEYAPDTATELLLHFNALSEKDATGTASISSQFAFKLSKEAMFGASSGAFSGKDSILSTSTANGTFFQGNTLAQDLSIEFWLYPTSIEEGEIILLWKSSKFLDKTFYSQSFSCGVKKSKLNFVFTNFFMSGSNLIPTINLGGKTKLVPKTWSHHLIRFDSNSGLLEYLLDGKPEDVTYTTDSKRESGTVFLPVSGSGGNLEIGTFYYGLMDELRISRSFRSNPVLKKHLLQKGCVYFPAIDLGYTNSKALSLNAVLRNQGNSGADFFIRAGNTWDFLRDENAWHAVKLDQKISASILGRFVQIRCDLYPDGKGLLGSSLSTVTLSYLADTPPRAPDRVIAVPENGAVTLTWKRSAENDVAGYLIYYGTSEREYFGVDSTDGKSPIDVKNINTFKVEGLKNGVLYYFAIAAYDKGSNTSTTSGMSVILDGTVHVSEFSMEVSARPSRTLE